MARWRILAIDDDEDILELIEMTLQGEYDVLTLSNPVHSMDLIEAFQPDLIILDIMMPKVTGYKVIEQLRDRKDTQKMPVVFLSAKDTIRDQRYGYKLGATTYLTKPFQPDRLQRNIDNIFHHTPPDRRPKRWNMEEARRRVQALLEVKGDAARKEVPKVNEVQRTTVHHREQTVEEDKQWRD